MVYTNVRKYFNILPLSSMLPWKVFRIPHLQQIALNSGISNTTPITSIEDYIVQSNDLPFFPQS